MHRLSHLRTSRPGRTRPGRRSEFCSSEQKFPIFANTLPPPGDNDRLTAQLRVIPLFDGRIKCIHVHVDDFADGHLSIIDSAWVFTRLRIALRMRPEKGPTAPQ